MTVEVGAPVVLVPAFDAVWHLPADEDGGTLCGLDGVSYVYRGPIRHRRACGVCRKAHRYGPHLDPLAEGSLIEPRRRGRPRLISDAQLAALHRAYMGGATVPELARQVYVRLGYASASACQWAIYRAFAADGYEVRDHGRRRAA